MTDPKYNMWCTMSQAFQQEMVDVILNDVPAVTFPLLNSLFPGTVTLFTTVYDDEAMDGLYRKWGGANYRNWSCYVQDKPENVPAIRADLDGLAAAYPTDFGVVGAWHYEDGRPVGTQWDVTDPTNPVLTGAPWYPQPAQTINFMPDVIVDNTDPENPIYGRPTDVTDVLLVLGQSPRIFTPD